MAGFLRPLAFRAFARRDGYTGWTRHRDEFRALARMTPSDVRAHQRRQLALQLAHAYASVPFYTARWDAIGFRPSPTVTLADLRRLPVLTKADIRERKDELLSRAVAADAMHIDYTGGTTGTQTAFYRDDACRVARFGRQWGVLEQCGYRAGDRRALIWGAHQDLLPDSTEARLKHRLRQFATADETICCTVMTREQMRDYHRRLLTFRPQVVYGYPNAIEQFARFVKNERLQPVRVGRVFCTAERLQDRQRALFREVFGADVFNLYCSREHGCVAFECAHHDRLHFDAGSVVVEILRDGRPVAAGETGEIVVTDLLNRAMPFIRYNTGDVATACDGPCGCGCGLPTIASLDGRTADTLFLPDGSSVAGLMLDDLFMELPVITHAQFVQEDVTSLDVNAVVKGGVTGEAGEGLRQRMVAEVSAIMGPEVRVRIHFVDDIPRNPRSGKYQEVICRVPLADRGRKVAVASC